MLNLDVAGPSFRHGNAILQDFGLETDHVPPCSPATQNFSISSVCQARAAGLPCTEVRNWTRLLAFVVTTDDQPLYSKPSI
jgi:hypothetical protein